MTFLDGVDAHWLWIAFGLLLAVLEMIVPGIYLIWFAVAAIVTGVLTLALDLGTAMQVIDFAFLALIAAFSARRFMQDGDSASADPLLNRRGAQMVGQVATVTQAIEHGSGRVHIGDSDWTARGPDAAAGSRVRITGSEGTALLVEPLALPAPEVTNDRGN